jgi:hypothetical protein
MDPQEADFLTQIAAGTDPLTALAAVPDEKPSGCLSVVLFALVVVLTMVA